MRRRIGLYIGGMMADIGDDSFILFNYAMTDLTEPAAVKNSYSRQVTLPGTPQNDRVFGSFFRLDRRTQFSGTYTGVSFDPSRKTPFTIYGEAGEILESGYVKLEQVLQSAGGVQYTVTLYGGLGSFFYGLTYNEEGDRRTLADLDYLGTDSPDKELDFKINAETVQEAWNAEHDPSSPTKWDVVNFAPCYNGVPDGDFDAAKALATPSKTGLKENLTRDGKTYKPSSSGYVVVNLTDGHDEWAAKDLRSYLQRPVFSMESFFRAICRPENNGGYEVDLSDLTADNRTAPYGNVWMTLPLLTELTQGTETDAEIRGRSTSTSGFDVMTWTVQGDVPSGSKVSAEVVFRPAFFMQGNPGQGRLSLTGWGASDVLHANYRQYAAIFIQLLAYTSDNILVGGSRVACICPTRTPKEAADITGFVPAWTEAGTAYYEARSYNGSLSSEQFSPDLYKFGQTLKMSAEGTDATVFKVHVASYTITESRSGLPDWAVQTSSSHSQSPPWLYRNRAPGEDFLTFKGNRSYFQGDNSLSSAVITTPDGVRSGAKMTKGALLNTGHTPADYLLSFCKMHGLHFLYDGTARKVSIVTRNTMYSKYRDSGEVIDLSDRIDRSQGIRTAPFVFESKWYDFILESDGGEFYDSYLSRYGREYGMQRVNTGYDFDADNINMMDGNIFRQGVTLLEKSPYFNSIKVSGAFRPSVFVDKGNSATYWDDEGNTEDFSISSIPPDAAVTYLNEYGHDGYDVEFARKLQLHDAEGKPLDGSGILVFWEGNEWYPYFKVTDDIPAMTALTGKPCWLLDPGDPDGILIPIFGRYRFAAGGWSIDDSLDFGIPSELGIPDVNYRDGASIYDRLWRSYLHDRFDVNTKVMRCRVDLAGLRVGQDLLRRFWWYGNSLWVLNSISNYSMTTWDTAECEFIQVRDTAAYTDGQTL